MESDCLAIPGIESHQIGSTANGLRLTGKVVAELERCLVGNSLEIMFVVNNPLRPFRTTSKKEASALKAAYSAWASPTPIARLA